MQNTHKPDSTTERVAVVTGAGSGIGLSVARHLAERRHPVALLDRNGDAVRDAAEKLRASGTPAVALDVDVTDRAAVDSALDKVRAELGPIRIMVTSAGIEGSAPFTDIALDDWDRILAVNLTGTFHCIQSAVPDMLDAGWGRIVTISSSSAQSGAPERAHYVASKGGVIALTKALAFELSPKGITANTIPPSIIDTPMARNGGVISEGIKLDDLAGMTPVRRLGTPDDVAAACAFLCTDDAGFITGQVIGVNGGWYL
ncbi:SDR family NAD(P)-dependent oxidoreductase [Rhodococcus chondri]|uniref:3-oxoacyl-[acyl-carrier-protein] reductase MabA n=1 Tax=Rhodococcus chondri TaxID=3065941 RepID=A0ABU7JV39_9NOCA|nr:SDR family NAD(P)-dependent oxidoreductase [Rhodococcus sp. CC-R104]MEE2033887.1 SDR family NAD(P)-dependent oxidoreductase [Rhodococcus sp. CC-R104]